MLGETFARDIRETYPHGCNQHKQITLATSDLHLACKLKITRDEKEQDLRITLGTRPGSKGGKSRSDQQNNMGSKLSERRAGFPIILQHDSVLKPTDCGGPLVNLDGQVVGINIARAGRVESYAIPSEAVRPLLEKLKVKKLDEKK